MIVIRGHVAQKIRHTCPRLGTVAMVVFFALVPIAVLVSDLANLGSKIHIYTFTLYSIATFIWIAAFLIAAAALFWPFISGQAAKWLMRKMLRHPERYVAIDIPRDGIMPIITEHADKTGIAHVFAIPSATQIIFEFDSEYDRVLFRLSI